jgi:hypothetical protein
MALAESLSLINVKISRTAYLIKHDQFILKSVQNLQMSEIRLGEIDVSHDYFLDYHDYIKATSERLNETFNERLNETVN